MSLTTNEGRACEAIVRLLEARTGHTRTSLRFPELEHHTAPVEIVFSLGQQLYALEHTLIEPFSGFVRMNAQASLLFEPIIAGTSGKLPNDSIFTLYMPAQIFDGLPMKDVRQLQQMLIAWLIAHAPTVPQLRLGNNFGHIAPTNPPGIPFQVRLLRYVPIGKLPHLQINHILQQDIEVIRQPRILEACNRKFPKLAVWKAQGARTILLLEDNDIQLTNDELIARAYVPIANSRTDRPDETYTIMTMSTTWYVWPILVGSKSYYDYTPEEYPAHTEFQANQLTPITKR